MATARSALWSRENMAWIAGLLEGEGCFTTGNSLGSFRVEIAMSDLDVVTKAHTISGLGTLSGPYKGSSIGTKDMYRWTVSRSKDAHAFMMAVYPWLGARRQERIRELLTNALARGPVDRKKLACRQGHLYTEENTYTAPNGKRYCRTCKYTKIEEGTAWQ